MRKRYAVVIIGTEGTAAAQKSELSRHRSESAAREAAKAERRRLYLVRPEDVGRYMVIVEHDGVPIANDDFDQEYRSPAVAQAFPLAPPAPARETPAPPPERPIREDRRVEEAARRASAPDSRVTRIGPEPETRREPMPEPAYPPKRAPEPASAPPAREPEPEPVAEAPEAATEVLFEPEPRARITPPPGEPPPPVADATGEVSSEDTGRMQAPEGGLRSLAAREPRPGGEAPPAADQAFDLGRDVAPAAAPEPTAERERFESRSTWRGSSLPPPRDEIDEDFDRLFGLERGSAPRREEPPREEAPRHEEVPPPEEPARDEEPPRPPDGDEREPPPASIRSRLDDIEVPSGPVPEEVIQRFAEMVRREEERRRRD